MRGLEFDEFYRLCIDPEDLLPIAFKTAYDLFPIFAPLFDVLTPNILYINTILDNYYSTNLITFNCKVIAQCILFKSNDFPC